MDADRLVRSKRAYAVRRVGLDEGVTVAPAPQAPPREGDLLLARVAAPGSRATLELTTGRLATLHRDDEIVVAYGSPLLDRFDAELPEDLGPCALVASGGLASGVRCRGGDAGAAVPELTRLVPVGLLADGEGRRLTVAGSALPTPPATMRRPPTLLVTGTSRGAGKTTTAVSLINGLTRAGLRVGACKITGTSSASDPCRYGDAGAREVLDFTDDGLVTTHRVAVDRLSSTAERLHTHLAGRAVDVIVVELADGVLQASAAALLATPSLHAMVDATVVAAGDAAGAVAGVDLVRAAGLTVVAVSGQVAASIRAAQEVRAVLDVPVRDADELAVPALAQTVLGSGELR